MTDRQAQGKTEQEKNVRGRGAPEGQAFVQTDAQRKRALRKEALARRDALTKPQRDNKTGQIEELLFAHPWYRKAELLLVYASYVSEVSTEGIIRHALQNGKRVYCPVITGKRQMIFCALDGQLSDAVCANGFAAMETDCHGIPQPDVMTCAHYVYQPEKSLMLMPGCAFDGQGSRIGYGGGFYDSFLEKQPMRTIALFFSCQQTDMQIPVERHDVRPELILTENGFRDAQGGNERK